MAVSNFLQIGSGGSELVESAIDAISLYLLNMGGVRDVASFYISIAGVANQKTIDRIKRQSILEKIILAVDNDAAGDECRKKNKDIEHLIPSNKDWNEDLMNTE